MKQLKQVELKPLTNFDSLNLNVSSEKKYDLTDLDEEQTNKLFTQIYEIISKSQGAIIGSNIGDNTYVNTQIKSSSSKSKIFTFPEPNPICIYYNSANRHLQQSYALKNKFFTEEQHFDTDYHYDNFIEYFQETSEGVILLSTTIEGFINQLLPDSLEIEINGIKKNKDEIEWLDINTKLRRVLPYIIGVDFQQTNPKDYDNICLVIDLRNDLIHLKKSIAPNITYYQLLFKRLMDFKHITCSDSVYTFVNTMVPDYFVEKK
ncbi:hypothetical protein [Leadbetterella sp. DM7]|uniref:hypothetical protein n=1 Tax=Leadbetterella sp. DM7 TaxID=3235085 RepID=UPI00349EC4AB